MRCSICGSEAVTWRGSLSNLTHTQCGYCGARDCQVAELPPEEPPADAAD